MVSFPRAAPRYQCDCAHSDADELVKEIAGGRVIPGSDGSQKYSITTQPMTHRFVFGLKHERLDLMRHHEDGNRHQFQFVPSVDAPGDSPTDWIDYPDYPNRWVISTDPPQVWDPSSYQGPLYQQNSTGPGSDGEPEYS